eukprot:3657938-Rhodomonas_salina.1
MYGLLAVHGIEFDAILLAVFTASPKIEYLPEHVPAPQSAWCHTPRRAPTGSARGQVGVAECGPCEV